MRYYCDGYEPCTAKLVDIADHSKGKRASEPVNMQVWLQKLNAKVKVVKTK